MEMIPVKNVRPRIPTLQQIIGNATRADFDRLSSPLNDRIITSEDLGAGWATARPDLVRIRVRSGTGTVLKVTRCKVLSGKTRKG